MTNLPHLTTVRNADGTIKTHALYVSIPPGERARAVSDALVAELGPETNYKKSEFVCNCVVSGALEPIYQERVQLTLDIVDNLLANSDSYKLDKVLNSLRMALTGCPTRDETVFTGELSQEYKERYGE